MRTRLGRLLATAGVVIAAGSVGAVVGTMPAAAATPIVVGSCATSVQGAPGQPVSLSPSAVVQPIVDVLNSIPILGPPLVAPFRQAFLALPPIPIGVVPTGPGYLSGATVANQVVAQLKQMPLLGPVIGQVGGGVRQALTAGCGITMTGINAAAGQAQAVASAAASAVGQGASALSPPKPGSSGGTSGGSQQSPPAGQPGAAQPAGSGFTAVGGDAPGGAPLYDFGGGLVSTGRAAPFDYGDLPFALPGDWAPSPGLLYGNEVPGYAPQLGTLPAQDPVRTAAGGAQALDPGRDDNRVGAPVLLAVVMLSCVTAALVRRWVLTRGGAAAA
jgi:hypothetical protein